jgi:hypothetical protein
MTRKEGMAGAVSLAWDYFALLQEPGRSDDSKLELLITRQRS